LEVKVCFSSENVSVHSFSRVTLFCDASNTGCDGSVLGSDMVCHRNYSDREVLENSAWREYTLF